MRPYLEKPITKRVGGMPQVVKHLPSKQEFKSQCCPAPKRSIMAEVQRCGVHGYSMTI
jgi:hypothetical protein